MTTLDIYTADEVFEKGLSHKRPVTIRALARSHEIGTMKGRMRLFTREDIEKINAIRHQGRAPTPESKYHGWRQKHSRKHRAAVLQAATKG